MKNKRPIKFIVLITMLFLTVGTLPSMTICFGIDGHIRFEIVRSSHLFRSNLPESNEFTQNPYFIKEKHSENNDDASVISYDINSFLISKTLSFEVNFMSGTSFAAISNLFDSGDIGISRKISDYFSPVIFCHVISRVELLI